MGVKNIFYTAKFFCQTHAPEILVGIGLVGMAGTVALTCKAMLNVADILEDHKDFCENGISEADEEVRADLIKQDKKDTTIQIVKKVAPPVVMFAGSTACILAGFGILKTRYAASVAAYSALSQAYDLYRDRIKTKYGDEADEYGLYGIETIEETVKNPETGKKETVKKQVSDEKGVANPNTLLFDKYNYDLKSGSHFYDGDEAVDTAFVMTAMERVEEEYHRGVPIRMNDICRAYGFDQRVDPEWNKIILWKGHKGDPEFTWGEHFISIKHQRDHSADCGYGAEEHHNAWWISIFIPRDEIQQEMKDKLEEINYDRSRV